jgi:hypothetical protein
LHGSAKKVWRESGIDFSDDVLSCVYLLNLLDWATKDDRLWFNANLQLEAEEPTLRRVEELIMGACISKSTFFKDCLRKYRIAMGHDARGAVPNSPNGLESGLDGAYWDAE